MKYNTVLRVIKKDKKIEVEKQVEVRQEIELYEEILEKLIDYLPEEQLLYKRLANKRRSDRILLQTKINSLKILYFFTLCGLRRS